MIVTFFYPIDTMRIMKRRDLLMITIGGILALVVGLSAASLLGVDVGLLQGAIGSGFNGIYPP